MGPGVGQGRKLKALGVGGWGWGQELSRKLRRVREGVAFWGRHTVVAMDGQTERGESWKEGGWPMGDAYLSCFAGTPRLPRVTAGLWESRARVFET